MSTFSFLEPGNLWEAVSILTNVGEQSRPMAGGTDLLLKIRRGQLDCHTIVNLKKIEELKEIQFNGKALSIGALTTISAIVEDQIITNRFPVLSMAARSLGTPQIRNLATVGGNLCNASPAADVVVALLMYEARLKLTGPDGVRTVPVGEFFAAPGQTVLQQGEILTTIEVDVPPLNSRGVFIKHGRRKSHEIALVNVAVLLSPQPDTGRIAAARIALGAVAPMVVRVRRAEESLANREAGMGAWTEAAEHAMSAVEPIDDVRSTAAYRKQMVGVLTKRALYQAWGDKS